MIFAAIKAEGNCLTVKVNSKELKNLQMSRRERGQGRSQSRTVGKGSTDRNRSGKRTEENPRGRSSGNPVKKGTSGKWITGRKQNERSESGFKGRRGKPGQNEELSQESDKYLNKDGRVLRGRFGKRNIEEAQKPSGIRKRKIQKADDGSMRLNRFIANAGICSRREADTYISTGCVKVNGKIISELGTKVVPGDEVSFNGKVISAEKKVYVLLNKPKGFVTTLEDPYADKTVMDLVSNACRERIYPVGRLDKATTGLLLLTNDGDLTKKLTHPKHNRKKIYHAFLDKNISRSDLERIIEGITLEDGFVAADSVSYVDEKDKKQVGIEIHSGKNRIVRRIFMHLGYKVMKLDRVYFCGLTKKDLPRGKWRFLEEQEVQFLKMGKH
jgi:23S rRNA pseudouridine2605 synthase